MGLLKSVRERRVGERFCSPFAETVSCSCGCRLLLFLHLPSPLSFHSPRSVSRSHFSSLLCFSLGAIPFHRGQVSTRFIRQHRCTRGLCLNIPLSFFSASSLAPVCLQFRCCLRRGRCGLPGFVSSQTINIPYSNAPTPSPRSGYNSNRKNKRHTTNWSPRSGWNLIWLLLVITTTRSLHQICLCIDACCWKHQQGLWSF